MQAFAPKPQPRSPDGRTAPGPAGRESPDYSRALAFHAVPVIQAWRGGGGGVAADSPAGAGDPTGMPGPVRAKMEGALGADLSDVRVHAGSRQARELGARAFTRGSEVHVAPGYWAPETRGGQELLGHELVHVLQQRSGRVAPTSHVGGAALNDDAGLEREAHALGSRAAARVGDAAGVAPAPAARASTPARGVVQRWPGRDDLIHGPLLDRYSADTGVPRDQASQHSPGYRAWLELSRLESMGMEQLLDAAGRLEASGSLGGVLVDARSLPNGRYGRMITALQVVHQVRGPGGTAAAANATIAASGLPPADQAAMTHFVRLPFARGADQRATPTGAVAPPGPAAAVPGADLARELGYELDPSSRPAPAAVGAPPPARIPWDGRDGAPGKAAARAAMQAELFLAFDAYLLAFHATTVAALAPGSRVPFTAPAAPAVAGAAPPTGVVDIANQARSVLETKYAVSLDAAAATPAQGLGRDPRVASPAAAQNIFDPYVEADRSTLTGVADLAPAVAWWIFENDVPGVAGVAGSRPFATEILAAHKYSTQDAGAEAFRWAVANAYATASAANRRELIDYRLTGWNERGARGITLLSAFTPGADPALAERTQRWAVFKTAVHESLHLRTHPAFSAADQGRGTMVEGFTEMFSIDTLNTPSTGVLPRVRAGSMEGLRQTVEGALSTPTPVAAVITDAVTPGQYAAHRAAAERIRDGGTPVGGTRHDGVGEAAVRAAYFQGHVEYLGLAPAGSRLGGLAAAGAPVRLRVPGGISSVDDLAWRSGVSSATLMADNPGITTPLPATAVLNGCREHVVVMADATHPVTGARTLQPESRANIAAQHGVSEADLARANPDLPLDPATSGWAALTTGRKILIPRH